MILSLMPCVSMIYALCFYFNIFVVVAIKKKEIILKSLFFPINLHRHINYELIMKTQSNPFEETKDIITVKEMPTLLVFQSAGKFGRTCRLYI